MPRDKNKHNIKFNVGKESNVSVAPVFPERWVSALIHLRWLTHMPKRLGLYQEEGRPPTFLCGIARLFINLPAIDPN